VDFVDTVDNPDPLLPRHGGYRNLKTFQLARLIYDLTQVFCDRYIERTSRTRDQMVQAARSGTQNIAEGSMASATSRKIELKLTGVARASLEELRLDYEDYLRQHNLRKWERADPRRQSLIDRRPQTLNDIARWEKEVPASPSTPSTPPEVAANAALALISVAVALLSRQIAAQAAAFEDEGGFTERLYRHRARKKRLR
jgi:four helix bundle suffix protein